MQRGGEGAGPPPRSPASRLPMRPKNCWGRGLRAILCRKCSRGSGSSSCGGTAAGAQRGPPPAPRPTAAGGSARHPPPRSRSPAGGAAAAGAHLHLVAVGPVGPVAEVVGGAHLLGQRPRRGQEEHGESQRESHRRLDVLLRGGAGRGDGATGGEAAAPAPGAPAGRAAAGTRARGRPGTRRHAAPRTRSRAHAGAHLGARSPAHTDIDAAGYPPPPPTAPYTSGGTHAQGTPTRTQGGVRTSAQPDTRIQRHPSTHIHAELHLNTPSPVGIHPGIHAFPHIHTQAGTPPSHTYPAAYTSSYKLTQTATHLRRTHLCRATALRGHTCLKEHTHPFAHPDTHVGIGTKTHLHTQRHTRADTQACIWPPPPQMHTR